MNRWMNLLNFLGVMVLVVLCAVQWMVNRAAHLQIADLQRSDLQQKATIVERDKAIQGSTADLEDFRGRLQRSGAALQESQSKLDAATGQIADLSARAAQLAKDEESLKASMDKWSAAVADRDAALKRDQEQLQGLVSQRNEAIVKYNDLARQYNAAEKELQQAAETVKKLTDDRQEAVEKFNALAKQYNALQMGDAARATAP